MNKLLILVAVILLGVVCMALTTSVDIDLSVYLYEHKRQWFVDLMCESIFELEMAGGQGAARFNKMVT